VVQDIGGGDFLVSVRHDGVRAIELSADGSDDERVETTAPRETGRWRSDGSGGAIAKDIGASRTWTFTGNRVRLVGDFAPDGGLADVQVDGIQQLAGIDAWSPTPRRWQTLYERSGLLDGPHTIAVAPRGVGNPRSHGSAVSVRRVIVSDAKASPSFGAGGGPGDAQRMVFGFTGREDLRDSAGARWRPATEVVTLAGTDSDSVAATWWQKPVPETIAGTSDPDLYRYGIHFKDFTVNVTVAPGVYHVSVKLAATRGIDSRANCITIYLNGREVVTKMDVARTAGGPNRAADLVFNDVRPEHGVIALRFVGGDPASQVSGEAFAQALEVAPGPGGEGLRPVAADAR
jgi:hypothetical protein